LSECYPIEKLIAIIFQLAVNADGKKLETLFCHGPLTQWHLVPTIGLQLYDIRLG